jgi:UDP-N-acetylmuramate: L-alanyl-gamma-D-glutamyl-meso-diaminopimelate ligase
MKWFHLIGVCGKATANIAKAFQEKGWFVTGSDSQFFPPASDLLNEYNINTIEGYSYEHLTKEFWQNELESRNKTLELGKLSTVNSEHPDLVLFISHLTNKNKEYLFAKKKNLDIRPYAKILGEYLIKPESIVVTGTAGKTTTTALITFIMQKLGLEPSYMIGADVVNITDSLQITDTDFSVIEGDEYHNTDPEIEGKAKFLEYKPRYLVITNIGWEHQDVFPTQEKYIEEFAKAAALVPEDGVIVAHAGDKNIDKALENATCKVVRYSLREAGNENRDEQNNHNTLHWSVKQSGDFYKIYNEKNVELLQFETSLLGEYNIENILAAVAVVLNIPARKLPSEVIWNGTKNLDIIKSAIKEFKGVNKRLEILHEDEKLVIVDDFGVAPNRAKNSLETLRTNYPDYKITAVFEPNSGSRPSDNDLFNQMYKNAFKDADRVIIPDLSTANDELVSSEQLVERLTKLGFDASYVQSSNLLSTLSATNNSKNLIVFFSSYRLTEIARELVKSATGNELRESR